MNKNSKGFTLIELLVVIAIIGILAALVLVSLGNARSKAQDARIKSDLAQLHVLAEISFDSDNSSYAGVELCMDTPSAANCDGGVEASVTSLKADLEIANGAGNLLETESIPAAWCAHSVLASDPGETVCVDSSGATTSGTCTAATGLCTP